MGLADEVRQIIKETAGLILAVEPGINIVQQQHQALRSYFFVDLAQEMGVKII